MGLLAGRYEIIRTIASGGMGTVQLARAVGVGGFERLVAIKVMHPHYRTEPEFVSMFLDEARLAALIRHPNVVATIDVQDGEDGLFLVMEYVEGPSLKHLRHVSWKRGERLPLDITLRIFMDLLNGLHAAHEQAGRDGEPLALVHRDVSPPNILVGGDGVTRITDFGVARAETRLSSTRGGKLKGKLPYMPPEQLRSEPIDRRCDVYAAGVVLWEELAGERLFAAESEGALLHQILAGVARRPRDVVPDLPLAIDEVCMRAVAARPEDRFATAADFAEALEAAAMTSHTHVGSTRAVARYIASQEGALTQLQSRLRPGGAAGATPASSPGPASAPVKPSASISSSGVSSSGVTPPVSQRTSGVPSGVTAGAATIDQSSVVGPRRAPKRRLGMWVGAAAIAGVGVGGVMVALSGQGTPDGESAPAGGPAAERAGGEPGDLATAVAAPPQPAPTPLPAETSSRPLSSSAPSTSSAVAGAPAPPPKVPPPVNKPSPKPPPVKPPPSGGADRYDPSKL